MSWLAARIPANDHNHGDRVSSWSLSGPGHKTAARTGRCPGVDVCEACGERNPAGSAFCVYCGVYLGWDQREGEEQSAPNAAPTAPPTAASAGTGQTPASGQPGAGQAPPAYPGSQGPAYTGGQQGAYSAGNQAQPAGHAYEPAGVSPYDVTAPQPTVPLPGVQPIPPGQTPCPSCGNPNPTSRRFCGKC